MYENQNVGTAHGANTVDSQRHGGDNVDMNRLQNLERRTDKIEDRLGHIEHDVSSLKVDVSILKVDVSILKSDVSTLKSDVSIIKSDISFLKTSIASIDAKLDIAGIRATVQKAHTDIYKWVATLAITVIAVMSSLDLGVHRIAPMFSSAAQQSPAPQPNP
jgi:archaellum component FlaC